MNYGQQLQSINYDIEDYKNYTIQMRALYNEKVITLNSLKKKGIKLQGNAVLLSSARDLLEKCNIASREFVKHKVALLVTKALQVILDDSEIQFQIEFETKRNQVEANFTVVSTAEGKPIEGDILFTRGGGIVDIIGIPLRMIIMQLMKISGPLILDEPGKMISAEYIDNFGKFLVQMSKTFSRQIILITHNKTLAQYADNVISVSQTQGISRATCQKI